MSYSRMKKLDRMEKSAKLHSIRTMMNRNRKVGNEELAKKYEKESLKIKIEILQIKKEEMAAEIDEEIRQIQRVLTQLP